MFKEGTIYKHENASDVAFFVLNTTLIEDGVELKGYWVNVHYHELGGRDPFTVEEQPRRIFIHANKLEQWKEYDETTTKGIRHHKKT